MDNLSNYRKSYEKNELTESNVDSNPMMQFRKWFYEVEEVGGIEEVNAMTLATIGLDGFPKARIVLLKAYNEEGFIFYTNYDSEKGRAIIANPKVAISFFWPSMERQVVIKGRAEKIPENISDNYFDSRPEGSKLGAVVSPQSQVIPSSKFLQDKLKSLEEEYSSKKIERPSNWGGFLIRPQSIEFWQGRPNRLHDRIRFTLENDLDWKIERLAP